MSHANSEQILVLSSLFPSSARPKAGLFVRERMFRVNSNLPLLVVSPVPWFPGQGLIRFFKKDYRPMPAPFQVQQGVRVFFPKFLALPYFFRHYDASMMARSCHRLIKQHKLDNVQLIDSHFAYPDGLAATLLGQKLAKPVTITMRGTEVRHAQTPLLRARLVQALTSASRVFSVSSSLKQLAVGLGITPDKIEVVGNGVDSKKFYPLDRQLMRQQLNIDEDAQVLITVGGLVERKGFHRVIECLPELVKKHPKLCYLIVGGANPEGNFEPQIRELVSRLKLENHVCFVGERSPDQLKQVLSAADAFVLASSNEGWANVILEAMACGIPVVASDVGGNAEVICQETLGMIVPFGDQSALQRALDDALITHWDSKAIIDYALANSWDSRVEQLTCAFKKLMRV